jgi:hypothetical protein
MTHQAGDYVVEADQFRGTVRALHSEKDFCRSFVVMDAEVERALSGHFDFLGDMVATVGEGKAGAHIPPLSSTRTMLVPTWCQTALIQPDLGAPIMTASPSLIGLMAQHGCPQVGYLVDSASNDIRNSTLFVRLAWRLLIHTYELGTEAAKNVEHLEFESTRKHRNLCNGRIHDEATVSYLIEERL